MKNCSKCQILKPLEDFYRDKARTDGVEPCCKKCKLQSKVLLYNAHSAKIINNSKNYSKINEAKIRPHKITYSKQYRRNNRGKCNYWTATYRATKIKATPKWLTQDHLNEIKQLYKESQRLQNLDGIERHVDHIVPLRGKDVCGLHVPWNLQILTKTENLKKKNNLEA